MEHTFWGSLIYVDPKNNNDKTGPRIFASFHSSKSNIIELRNTFQHKKFPSESDVVEESWGFWVHDFKINEVRIYSVSDADWASSGYGHFFSHKTTQRLNKIMKFPVCAGQRESKIVYVDVPLEKLPKWLRVISKKNIYCPGDPTPHAVVLQSINLSQSSHFAALGFFSKKIMERFKREMGI